MRRITLDSIVPGLKRKVAECTREELLATSEHQRAIEQLHADAIARAARAGIAVPPEACETAWRTHCRAHFYAALASGLPPDEPVRQHRGKADLERIWQEACAAAGEAPWQVHAATVREREARRNRERRAEAKAATRSDERPERTSRRDKARPGAGSAPGRTAATPGKPARSRSAADRPAPERPTPERTPGERPTQAARPGRPSGQGPRAAGAPERMTPRDSAAGRGRPGGRRTGRR
ncbi:hypothetical protein STAQ_50050 [Allostella sp. ATCC 35155]|nr:hypothetical protein STAQ_50050 [Stella sp. ATCC 35155]